MQYLLSAEEMRACDAYTIETLGVSGALLMENAARAAADFAIALFGKRGWKRPSALVVCGSGNNGGDGFAFARQITRAARVSVYWTGGVEKMSAETLANFRALERHAAEFDVTIRHIANEADAAALSWGADCLVDAMLGVGGGERPRGTVAAALRAIAALPEGRALRIAIDVPTGLNSDTGAASEYCFCADYTLTMAAAKRGMMLREAPEFCGAIVPLYIGIPESVITRNARVRVLEDSDARALLPPRARRTDKRHYGKVAIVAGSEAMPGAAAITANACVQAGAGLVKLFSTAFHPALCPEAMTQRLGATATGAIAETAIETLAEAAAWCDVMAMGPGLGTDAETLALCELIIEFFRRQYPKKPLILDADVLRCVRAPEKLWRSVVLTPHHGEFARLTGMERSGVADEAAALAPEWARKLDCVVLLKNVPTIISDGTKSYWNATGNAGMATGGSGDALAGIIAALAAQGLAPLEAAALGAFLHGKAGDLYAAHYNQESLTAQGLVETLRFAFPA